MHPDCRRMKKFGLYSCTCQFGISVHFGPPERQAAGKVPGSKALAGGSGGVWADKGHTKLSNRRIGKVDRRYISTLKLSSSSRRSGETLLTTGVSPLVKERRRSCVQYQAIFLNWSLLFSTGLGLPDAGERTPSTSRHGVFGFGPAFG